ncbi:oxidoreductase [Streptomyces bottropensis]|uniref:oxidoreductase n=1 Tax=Streptomyces bottropensis TaxID=42235 RepID=UPI0036C43637
MRCPRCPRRRGWEPHRDTAAGEDFNIVAPTALNVRGFVHIAAAWFGQTATLEPVTWDQFRQTTSPQHAEQSWDHLHRSHCLTIEKARTLLRYTPRYEPEIAVLESVRWMIAHGELDVAGPLVA